ncbi:LLM class flavin-dependent oxidoreductase [Flavihumibacter fluvii]|uniref:LLM class flavin-dependent oxidoreductase n=1 Tax=Flavihumibacter fluvii TaxID=2838157 RepID=UPI001BDE26F3|nr:LLM class flavin-dependent oxidoreductase [Flavihumibacter fluvii]ULQ52090.1 LLM class flavin-dependent oxidoreductase [Flavihumibacter fluvii]
MHTPYSILELAVVSKGSTPADAFRNSLTLAQKAEELGYTRFWLAEHHNMISVASSATVVLIGHIAVGTQKIRVGSGGIMLPNHSPLIVAEQFGTLGTLYPGRIDLGLGRAPGTDQVTAHAIRPERMQAVYQFPEDISRIQQYFSTKNAAEKVRVNVAEGIAVPIYILGSSTDSAKLAAKKGLPYAFASHFSSGALLEALAIYHNEFQPSEFLREPYTIACVNVIAAETDAEAERLSTSYIRMILGVLTGQMDYLQEPTDMTEELHQLRKNPALQQMMKYAFIGSKETVKSGISAFLKETRVSELMVATSAYDPADRLTSYRIVAEIMREPITISV